MTRTLCACQISTVQSHATVSRRTEKNSGSQDLRVHCAKVLIESEYKHSEVNSVRRHIWPRAGLMVYERTKTPKHAHMHTHAPLFSHTYRVVLRGLKLGQWLHGARLCSTVGLGPAPQPPSDSDTVSFHHLLA